MEGQYNTLTEEISWKNNTFSARKYICKVVSINLCNAIVAEPDTILSKASSILRCKANDEDIALGFVFILEFDLWRVGEVVRFSLFSPLDNGGKLLLLAFLLSDLA